MPVYKRGGVYYIDTYVSGRRIRKSAGKNATRADAKAIERKIQDDALRARQGIQPDRPLSAAVVKWMKDVLPHMKDIPRTESHIKALTPYIKGKTLEQAPDVAEDYKKACKHLSPGTVNRRLAILRAICNLAYKSWRWTDSPIGERIKMLPMNNARHVYLTPDEVTQIADCCDLQAARDAILLTAYTGLRKGELFSLDAGNVRDGCIVLGVETKTGRPRVIPLPEEAQAIAESLPLPITPDVLRKEWERARKLAGFENVRFHDLRHTYASWLVQAGAPLRAVQDLLGHSTITMTQRYSHLGTEHLRQAVSLIGKKK